MALQKCHECGKDVSSEAATCPNCGVKVVKKGYNKSVGCIIVIAAMVVVSMMIGVVSQCSEERNRAAVNQDSVKKATEAREKRKAEFLANTEKYYQDLVAAQESKNYPKANNVLSLFRMYKKTDFKDIVDRGKIIDAEMGKVAAEQERIKEEKAKNAAIVLKANMQSQREQMADRMETNLLSQGMDVRIKLSGPGKTVMKMTYVLMSRPLVYKLTNESDFLDNLKKAGFKKVIFHDGYNYSWTYDLKK